MVLALVGDSTMTRCFGKGRSPERSTRDGTRRGGPECASGGALEQKPRNVVNTIFAGVFGGRAAFAPEMNRKMLLHWEELPL